MPYFLLKLAEKITRTRHGKPDLSCLEEGGYTKRKLR